MTKIAQRSRNHKSSKSARRNLSVVSDATGWVIQESGSSRAGRVYATQREAEQAARNMISDRTGGEVLVHGRNGRIRNVSTYTLGMDGFAAISAIESIFLTQQMQRDFRMLDRQNLSPEARRRWLIEKYGK